MVFLTRRERFSAAHRLFRPEWSDEMNAEVYGACSNPNWHGHNYVLFVTVQSEIDEKTGYGLNLKALSSLLKSLVIEKLDHKNLNLDVDFLIGKVTTTEVVAIAIWNQIKLPLEALGCKLHCVKLVETENNYVEYFG